MSNNCIYEHNILNLYDKYNYIIVKCYFTNRSFELLFIFFYLNTIEINYLNNFCNTLLSYTSLIVYFYM